MTSSNMVLCAIAVAVTALNVVTLHRLWASPIFETPQKIAQTILMWVVPRSVLAVRYLLREQRVRRSVDPVTGAAVMVSDGVWDYGMGHHGSLGGDHGHAESAGAFVGNDGSSSDGGGGAGGSDGGAGGDGGV